MKNQKLTLEEKGSLMDKIIGTLKSEAFLLNKHFDGANIFFSLAFKSDKELIRLKKMLNI